MTYLKPSSVTCKIINDIEAVLPTILRADLQRENGREITKGRVKSPSSESDSQEEMTCTLLVCVTLVLKDTWNSVWGLRGTVKRSNAHKKRR